MDYVPRWFDCHYTEESPLRKLYTEALTTPRAQLSAVAQLDALVRFHAPIFQPRLQFLLDLPHTAYQQTSIALVVPSGFQDVYPFDSAHSRRDYPSSAASFDRPTFYQSVDGTRLVNPHLVRFSVVPTSGVLDLSTYFSQFPPVSDTFVQLKPEKGSPILLGVDDLPGGRLSWNDVRPATVCFLCQTLLDAFLTGEAWVEVSGTKVRISPAPTPNVWDRYLGSFGLRRRGFEDNSSAKFRAQTKSLGRLDESYIASELGLSSLHLWDTGFPLSLASSGVTRLETPTLDRTVYMEEVPTKDGDHLVATAPVLDAVVVRYRGTVLDPTLYAVEGGKIRLLSEKYKSFSGEEFTVSYIFRQLSLVEGEFVEEATFHVERDIHIVLLNRGVRIHTTPRAVRKWVWDKTESSLKGLASFD